MAARLEPATAEDAGAIAALQTAVASALTEIHGRGHWSANVTDKGVRARMRRGTVYVLRRRGRIVASLCLTTRKPWAIDRAHFTPVPRPLYLVDMAVTPLLQRSGVGRSCLAAVERIAREWPAQAVWLCAYDTAAGAGGFYHRCGYRQVGRAVYRTVPLVYYEASIPASSR